MSEGKASWGTSPAEAHRQAQIRRLTRASDALVTAWELVQAADAELRAALAACREGELLVDDDEDED